MILSALSSSIHNWREFYLLPRMKVDLIAWTTASKYLRVDLIFPLMILTAWQQRRCWHSFQTWMRCWITSLLQFTIDEKFYLLPRMKVDLIAWTSASKSVLNCLATRGKPYPGSLNSQADTKEYINAGQHYIYLWPAHWFTSCGGGVLLNKTSTVVGTQSILISFCQ